MTEFNKTFSTIIGIDICANGDFLKWESVLNSPVADVFTYLNYRAAKAEADSKEFEYKQRLNRQRK